MGKHRDDDSGVEGLENPEGKEGPVETLSRKQTFLEAYFETQLEGNCQRVSHGNSILSSPCAKMVKTS